ncbi:phosphate:acyl-[acyl carrier protein] acyltransferase [Marinitoga hydrogenitolerans DSM 16785]|uniref:Phosphate acyltransferase n=1 Tax=Marinitoga hydrogenitolerans (strain DSM 16785 / JCM 12826 / AT1271) TaxID=1122195 RepID=A0A1M4WZH8_MARH1|nr:phosphate acyltransferase PlsX [Marinitoga hydrogenitolerans]SHE86649.1 phosphate:acyl-[acyl carrier protein] acyltransferase [Marinitoga hydrogenitolerans DSM 16785]
MSEKPKIGLDLFGGDNAPNSNLEGAIFALKNGYIDELYLIGGEESLKNDLPKEIRSRIKLIKAENIVDNHTKPTEVLKLKKSSIYIGNEMMKKGELDAFVSAGNTGALLAAGTFITGRISGIDRPALVIPLPGKGGKPRILVDGGANAELKPAHFISLAKEGVAFAKFLGIKEPKVHILNIGTEESKGTKLVKEAAEYLKSDPKINYIGFVEGRDIFEKEIDVIVTDGFTGNNMLKTIEGTAYYILSELKEKISNGGLLVKLGALLMKKSLKGLKSSLDYRQYGGTFFLGINGILVKAHGSSDSEAIANALSVANKAVKENIVDKIKEML